VPQTTGAFDNLTVAETVAHFASFYRHHCGPTRRSASSDWTSSGRRNVPTCPGGQKRKLDVALGIIGDPELLFLDEPTTGLDPVARRQTWDLVRALTSRGRTTVLTTHYLEEAEQLADRAGIIVRGRLVEIGAVADLGERSSAPSEVRFRRTGALSTAVLPPLPAATSTDLDEIRPNEPSGSGPRPPPRCSPRWSPGRRPRESPSFHELNVRAPTLEDVYLTMIEDDKQHRDDNPDGTEVAT
jgi:ABC-2 type transport system ATP-binding protein